MDLVQTVINGAVVGLVVLVAGYVLNQRFEGLERRLDRFEDRVDARFTRLEDGVAELRSDMNLVRSDLLRVALAVGAETRPQTG